MNRTPIYVGAVVALLVLVAGGIWWFGRSDDPDSVATAPSVSSEVSTVAPGTLPPATSPPETSPPETSPPETAPPDTAPPDTAPPETAPPETAPGVVVPPGWRPASLIPEAQLPVSFESSWIGSPSPAIDPGAELGDGVYWFEYVAQNGESMTIDVGRFESCTILGDEIACGPGPYGSEQIGRLTPPAVTRDVRLDDSVRVLIEGWECDSVVGESNGVDFGALLTMLSADYDRAFAQGLAAGADPFELMAAARNDPTNGFSAPPAACDDGFSLVWSFDGSPPILIQSIVDFETGGPMDPAMLLFPTAVQFVDGAATLYFYAGFFS
jgi:hypothetical protein